MGHRSQASGESTLPKIVDSARPYRSFQHSSVGSAVAVFTRRLVVVAIIAGLGGAFGSSSARALAMQTPAWTTPTAATWPTGTYPHASATYTPGIGTPTPTPSGYGPYQPTTGQPRVNGSSVQPYPAPPSQAYPGGPGQQSVPLPVYPGAPSGGPGAAPGGASGSAIVSSGTAPGSPDSCYGDELITFSPESPRVGDELVIAVTSSHPHPYGRLAGTEPLTFMRERPGQRGLVWEWTMRPSYVGEHEYTFYVDSTVACQRARFRVLPPLATQYGPR